MKRWICLLLAALLLLTPAMALEQPTDEELKISAPSAILMERSTGTVLYEKNADEHLSPASVTKIMTLLLIMEQLDSGQLDTSDIVTASAQASSMGGSQIWLKEGEQMSVDEMLKCIAVNSANDCAVAMAEHISGSEEAFTKRMNDRAKELGMGNTQFLHCTGLTDDPGHYTTARDIACMSRALLAHPRIRDYTTIWMDTVRDGRFGLANTNKLIHAYPGATGLKTGYTQQAMHCSSTSPSPTIRSIPSQPTRSFRPCAYGLPKRTACSRCSRARTPSSCARARPHRRRTSRSTRTCAPLWSRARRSAP